MARIALLIGVSEYQQGLNQLAGAVKDVEAMQRVLQHPEMGGFDEGEIIVMPNPQRQDMENAIEKLFDNRKKDDLLLLYFSGHGITDDSGRLYLTNSQTRKYDNGNLVKTSATSASLIHEFMENSRSQRQVIILDACFSGAFAEGMKAKDDSSVDINQQLGGKGRVVLTSSSSSQYSFEQIGEELSVYTRYIVNGIETGAADTDNDGVISIDELHEYASKKVQEAAPAMSPKIYAVEEGFKIEVAKAPIGDPKLEYRKEVEKSVPEGKISSVSRRILNRYQNKLGLSDDEANQIQDEVLEPYRKYQANLQEYEEALQEELQHEETLSQFTLHELKRLQKILQLRDEDVKPIHNQLITSPHPSAESDDLSSEKGIVYTRLRDLIKAGNWKNADYETYLVMLQVVGREEGDLKKEERLNFPITDLCTINSLWTKYSKGNFGFSVQKKIFLSIGGKADGNYEKEAWEKFSIEVRWKVNNDWILYGDLSFDTSMPVGHLPRRVFSGTSYGKHTGLYLLSHRDL